MSNPKPAATLVPGKGRALASSTSCGHQALTRAAAKGLGVMDDQVLLFELGTDKPVPWERFIGPEWQTFDARVKGSVSQGNLLSGGAS
jgi:hypothetical protein